jgi:sulfotransferase
MPSRAFATKNDDGAGRKLHFISGLPRAGSTLLSALLKQNPRFHAHMSGPLGTIFDALLGAMSGRSEFSLFISDAQRARILRGIFTDFYADTAAEVVFDTSRAWCSRLPALKTLFPDAKMIVCVREIGWIIDSIERLIQKNAFQPSSIFNFQTGGTVFTRANGVAAPDGLVGHAYDAVKEAFYGEDAHRLLLVQYETLVSRPAEALAAIYAFIGEPGFSHEFKNIQFDAAEFDARAGTPGLHTVHPDIRAPARQTILPPDLFRRFENLSFWREPHLNPRNVKIV